MPGVYLAPLAPAFNNSKLVLDWFLSFYLLVVFAGRVSKNLLSLDLVLFRVFLLFL